MESIAQERQMSASCSGRNMLRARAGSARQRAGPAVPGSSWTSFSRSI